MVVLAIQNDPANFVILSEALKKVGAAGVFCGSAESGIELLFDSHCDLIIVDLVLPENKGMWVLRKIRENERLRGIPIIVIAPNRSEVSLRQCTALEISEYLVSPVTAELVAQKISVLERITQLTREVTDKKMFSNILIEEISGLTAFRFCGHFSRYSVLQFQNICTPAYRDALGNDFVILNFSGIPEFGPAQEEPFRLVCEMVKPKQALIVAGKNLGPLMPLVSDPETCLFMNAKDAINFLDLKLRSS